MSDQQALWSLNGRGKREFQVEIAKRLGTSHRETRRVWEGFTEIVTSYIDLVRKQHGSARDEANHLVIFNVTCGFTPSMRKYLNDAGFSHPEKVLKKDLLAASANDPVLAESFKVNLPNILFAHASAAELPVMAYHRIFQARKPKKSGGGNHFFIGRYMTWSRGEPTGNFEGTWNITQEGHLQKDPEYDEEYRSTAPSIRVSICDNLQQVNKFNDSRVRTVLIPFDQGKDQIISLVDRQINSFRIECDLHKTLLAEVKIALTRDRNIIPKIHLVSSNRNRIVPMRVDKTDEIVRNRVMSSKPVDELSLAFGGETKSPIKVSRSIKRLREFSEKVDKVHEEYIAELQELLNQHGGQKLGSSDEVREFRNLINKELRRLGLKLELSDGAIARLAITPDRKGELYLRFALPPRNARSAGTGVSEIPDGMKLVRD